MDVLTIATGADGVATIPYFPAAISPLTMRVTALGMAPHTLSVPDHRGGGRITLKLGRPASLTGSVYYDSGEPASNVPIEVWAVENTYTYNGPRGEGKATLPPSLIHFDFGPVRTQADGSFRTPPQLLTGTSYKIMVRAEGNPLVISESLAATTELTTIPPIRLQQRRKLQGLVQDRQGKPVAGARVCLPSGEPSTLTDTQGRFLLEGMLPEKTCLLVKAEGFRFQGWPAIPARGRQERKLVLVRTSEQADHTMAPQPQPAPISAQESRALATRLLEPSLGTALAKGDLKSRFSSLKTLSWMDPARALELLEQHPLGDPGTDAAIRTRVAIELLTTDPKEAESVVNALATPGAALLGIRVFGRRPTGGRT